MTTVQPETIDTEALERFATRVAEEQNAGVAGVLAYIGDRLGLWQTLAGIGWVTPDDLAVETGLDARYLTEWLAAEAAAGYLAYDEDSHEFFLPPEHAAVLADDESPVAAAGGFEFQAGCWADADRVVDLFVSGGGIAWADRDPRLSRGAARFFRPLYRESLIDDWLAAADGVVERLEAGVRAADIGCGEGFATLLLASRYPRTDIVGIDPDRVAIADATRNAAEAGLPNVRFECGTSEGIEGEAIDVGFFFDAFHHVGSPLAVARAMRRALAPGGVLVLVEPRAADTVAENLGATGPLYYSPSTVLCIPDALAQGSEAPLGAQAGPTRLLSILDQAGFAEARVARVTDYNMVIEARRA